MISINLIRIFFTAIILVWATSCIDTDYISDSLSQPGKVLILQRNPAVMINSSIQLNASLVDGFGKDDQGMIIWNSANPQIAEIDASGNATGISSGQVYIYANSTGYLSDSVLLNVVQDINQVASVTVTPSNAQLSLGSTVQLTATAMNIAGELLQNLQFEWISSDPLVATVNNSGLVIGQSTGTTNVRAIASNVYSNPAIIEVSGSSRTGTFVKNPGQSHNVSGTVSLTERPGGGLQLDFESNFSSSGGPDVRVYLSNISGVNSSSFNVGSLKSTSGAQSYNIPPTINLNDYNWVVIHCVPFNVTFGYAQLQ